MKAEFAINPRILARHSFFGVDLREKDVAKTTIVFWFSRFSDKHLLIAATAISAAGADDWPQWMGPKRDNVWREKGILDTFPKDGLKVAWRAKVSNGYSGPAVADGLVFVTDFVSDTDLQDDNFKRKKFVGKERVQCIDVKIGQQKWMHDYPATYTMSYPNGPRCTPVVDAGKVYTLGAEGDLICFDAKTGKIQ